MQMYEVRALLDNEVVYQEICYADDEEDALDALEKNLQEKQISYSMCQAEEIN